MAPIMGRMAKIDTELHFSLDIANPGNLAGRLESSRMQFSSYKFNGSF